MVSNDQIVDIVAENSSINTVWFVYVIEVICVDQSSTNIDSYGTNVPKSQPYLLCNYLEKLNDTRKVLYIKEVKTNFYEEGIVYPIVEFEPNYNKKEDLFFLSNNKFIEVLECGQFTAMDLLF